MAPKKLSESEKKEIVELYSKPEESTATLASRFGVSSSTISRILKQNLSDDDYNHLVQQKRTGGAFVQSSSKGKSALAETDPSKGETAGQKTKAEAADGFINQRSPSQNQTELISTPSSQEDQSSSDDVKKRGHLSKSAKPKTKSASSDNGSSRRRRRRSRTVEVEAEATQLPIIEITDSSTDAADQQESFQDTDSSLSSHDADYADDTDDAANLLDDDLDDDLMDDDDFDDDLDHDLDDDDDDAVEPIQIKPVELVEIFPFSSAELPRTCYLVIDRSAELITRPLQEFGELGNFPSAELMESTLPIFDNHRVAKRFANRRTQRIVKVPDSRILRKTMPYLQSKGITRLLIDGQVYSLTDDG